MTYTQYFEQKQRPDGTAFICLTDDAPEALKDLVRTIHLGYFDGCLPNDWIYATISHAFDDLEENSIDNCSIEADCYYGDLYRWFGEPFALDYCAEYQETMGEHQNGTDIMTQIQCGQWLAKDRIYHAVDEWLTEQDNNEQENQE